MKKGIFISVFIILIVNVSFSQYRGIFTGGYIGIGTSLSSYLGGDFGSTFHLRFFNYHNYNHDYNYDNNNYNSSSLLSPIQLDLAGGVNLSRNLSVVLETSFIWHFDGFPRRNYEPGTLPGNYYYLDRNDNSSMFAIPIIISIRYFPFDRNIIPFYLSLGYGRQYTKESLDRIREIYTYDYGYYEYNNYEYPIASYSATEWLSGYKLSIGGFYNIENMLTGELELRFTNFNANKKNNSPLAMHNSPNIFNVALGTKVYFNF
jgi:hypothetical protein